GQPSRGAPRPCRRASRCRGWVGRRRSMAGPSTTGRSRPGPRRTTRGCAWGGSPAGTGRLPARSSDATVPSPGLPAGVATVPKTAVRLGEWRHPTPIAGSPLGAPGSGLGRFLFGRRRSLRLVGRGRYVERRERRRLSRPLSDRQGIALPLDRVEERFDLGAIRREGGLDVLHPLLGLLVLNPEGPAQIRLDLHLSTLALSLDLALRGGWPGVDGPAVLCGGFTRGHRLRPALVADPSHHRH